MKVANLILHIICSLFLSLDLLYWGLNFLMGFSYLSFAEFIQVSIILLAFTVAPLAECGGGIWLLVISKKISHIKYTIFELLIRILSTGCFTYMIIRVIKINIHHSRHKVPQLSTGYTSFSPVDTIGLALELAGIILTVVYFCLAHRKANTLKASKE